MDQNDSPDRHVVVSSKMDVPPVPNPEPTLLLNRTSPGSGVREYLLFLFKYKVAVLISFLVISTLSAAGVLVYSYIIYSPKFEARAFLLVKLGWENYTPDLSLDNRRAPLTNQSEILSSEVKILQSRDLRERVVNSLGPETIFPNLATNPIAGLSNKEAAILMLEKNITITPATAGNVLEVAFTHQDPVKSAAVVNQLVNNYIERRTEIYKDPKSVLFLEKKTEEYRQKIAESENKLRAFREETKIISFDEQRTALLNQQSALITSLNGTKNQIKEVQEKISEFEKQLSSLPKTSTTAAAADRQGDLESRLLTLQLQEKDLLAKYHEDNRLVVTIRNQIQMIKEHMESQAGRARGGPSAPAPVDPVYQETQRQIFQNKAELNALKARNASLDQQLQELALSIQTFEARENRNKELLREIAGNEEKFKTYRQKLEESRIYDELDRQKMSSVGVIEPAAVPAIPKNPPKPLSLLLAGALAISCLASLGIAFLLGMMKQSISTPSEIENRLNVPVLVTIPVK